MPNASWTWLIYMATHNNVNEWGEQSIARMRQAQTGEHIRVLVQQDTPKGCVRRMIGAVPEVTEELGEIDSGDPNTLLEFMRWGIQAAPADHYALVLWSHGSGWEPSELARLAQQQPAQVPVTASELQERSGSGPVSQVFFSSTLRRLLSQPTPPDRAIAFDDGSGHSLDTIELGQVLAQTAMLLGRSLDLLVMNACQMASVEVAYQLRDHVAVYVATEENMPASSLPYDDILSRLDAQPAMDSASLGRLLVERYCAFYRANAHAFPWGKAGFPAGATLAAFSLDRMTALVETVQTLAGTLRADLNGQLEAIWKAHRQAHPFSQFHLYDLASFCRPLAAQPTASPATTAAAQAVLAALTDPAFCLARDYTVPVYQQLGGLTTYLIEPDANGRNRISPVYAETAYAQTTRWGDVLKTYHSLASL